MGEHRPALNSSEYIHGLVQRDKERVDAQTLQRLQVELAQSFAAPDPTGIPLMATEVIARDQAKPAE